MRSQPAPLKPGAVPENSAASWRMAVALVWLAGFSLYFFTRPMPNLGATFAETRAEAWRVVPFVVLDWILPAEPAPASPVPSGWRFLPERLALWSTAALILAGAWGLGRWALRGLVSREDISALERFVFALGVGLSTVSLMTLGFGLLGFLHQGLFAGVLGAAALAGVGEVFWSRRGLQKSASATAPEKETPRLWWLCLLAVLPFLVAMLLGGVSPSTDFDVKEYHFGGPKEFFLTGRVKFLPHNVYTSFPFLTEMLTLTGMVLWGDWSWGALVGKSVLMAFIPLTGLAVLAAGRRWFSAGAGWLGLLVWLTTPWATRTAIIAYAEGGLTCYLFLAFFATGMALEKFLKGTFLPGWFLLAGFLAGSAMACKYTGLVSVVFPLAVAVGYVVIRHRRRFLDRPQKQIWLGTAGAFGLGVVIAVGPWLTKNLIETGNPVYPLAWSIFGGRDWDEELNTKWKNAHSPPHHRLTSLVVMENGQPGWVIDVMAVNDWLSPLLYGLAPLVLLVPQFRQRSRFVWLFAGWLFFAWWCFTHRLDRFWVPMLPVVALLAGAGAAWCRDRLWKIVCTTAIALTLLFNFVLVATQNAGYIAWLSDLEKAGEFTARLTVPEISALNQLPEDERHAMRVLSVGEAEIFDARFPIVYNTVFDRSIFEEWTKEADTKLPPAEAPMKSSADIRAKLREQGITHILVNWQEILRYRPTYGYTDYVHPGRFEWLVENGVLEAPTVLSHRPWDRLSTGERSELIKSGWRGKLRAPSLLEESIVLSAVYRVRRERLSIQKKRLAKNFPMGGIAAPIGRGSNGFRL